jgi:hypothetical protein
VLNKSDIDFISAPSAEDIKNLVSHEDTTFKVTQEVDMLRIRLGSKYPVPLKFDIEDYYRMGVIRKEDLIDGKIYIGLCRNATTARWCVDKNAFSYLRYKFYNRYVEEINHISDDDGYDVFLPTKLLD